MSVGGVEGGPVGVPEAHEDLASPGQVAESAPQVELPAEALEARELTGALQAESLQASLLDKLEATGTAPVAALVTSDRSVFNRVKSRLEYGMADWEVTDKDVDAVLREMDPLPIGGEFDKLVRDMARNPPLLDRFVENITENDTQGRLEKFTGWVCDARCDPQAKADVVRALAEKANVGYGAKDSMRKILESPPPGSAAGALSGYERARMAERFPEFANLVGGQADAVRKLVGENPPNVKAALDVMDPMPIGGEFDKLVGDMAKGGELDRFLKGALKAGEMPRFEKWIADPRCTPEAKKAVFDHLAKFAATPSDTGRSAANAMARLVTADPKGMKDLVTPELMKDHAVVAEAVAKALPNTFLKAIGDNPKILEDKDFAEVAGRNLTSDKLGKLMKLFKKSDGYRDEQGELKAMGILFQNFLAAHGDKDPKGAVAQFMQQAAGAGILNDPEDFGMVAGGLVAGMKRLCEQTKADEAKIKEWTGVITGALDMAGGKVINETAKKLIDALKSGFAKAGDAVASSVAKGNLDLLADHIWGAIGNRLTREPPPAWKDWVDPAQEKAGYKDRTGPEERARNTMEDVVRVSRFG
jgi:hypothetical protein